MTTVVEKPVEAELVNVSYSKAQAFRTCKFKYQQAHIEQHPDGHKPGLMAKTKSKALARGTHGHAILERFFRKVKAELTFPYDPIKCKEFIGEAVAWGITQDSALSMEINTQILHFGTNVFPKLGWEVLEIEKEYRIPVGTSSTGVKKVVPMTIDLIIRVGGQIVVVDHKFSADAYSETRIKIEPQIPIYLGVLRAMGIPAKYGIYNFMRTRKMKNVEDQVVQTVSKPNDFRIKRSFQEHLETTKEIVEYNKTLPLAVRTPNNNCDYCDFSRICVGELSGEDTTLMKRVDFAPNDYGYEE